MSTPLFFWHQDILDLFYDFPAPALESTISPGCPSSLNRRYLETSICVLGVLTAAGVSLLLGPSQSRQN